MKFLFGIMKPRQLPFFVNSLAKLDYVDVFLAEYMEIITAQNTIRNYFLSHGYDYLLFTSDDVEIPYTAPSQIMKDAETLKYQVITGWSRCRPNKPEANINTAPPPNIDKRIDKAVWYHEYKFITVKQIQQFIQQKKYIIPVWFTGFSITAISRSAVEKWTPKGWYFQIMPFKPTRHKGFGGSWASTDLWFSYQMWKNKIPIYADLNVYVPHNPIHFSHKYQHILVGKEKPAVKFIPAKKSL